MLDARAGRQGLCPPPYSLPGPECPVSPHCPPCCAFPPVTRMPGCLPLSGARRWPPLSHDLLSTLDMCDPGVWYLLSISQKPRPWSLKPYLHVSVGCSLGYAVALGQGLLQQDPDLQQRLPHPQLPLHSPPLGGIRQPPACAKQSQSAVLARLSAFYLLPFTPSCLNARQPGGWPCQTEDPSTIHGLPRHHDLKQPLAHLVATSHAWSLIELRSSTRRLCPA